MFDASSVYLHIMLVGMDGWIFDASYVFAYYASRDGWIVDLIIKKNQLYFCSPPNLVVVKYHELCLIG